MTLVKDFVLEKYGLSLSVRDAYLREVLFCILNMSRELWTKYTQHTTQSSMGLEHDLHLELETFQTGINNDGAR